MNEPQLLDDTEELTEIEDRLSAYLTTGRRKWAVIYQLMREVHDKRLYAGKYASFTQWVNNLAKRNHYHPSTLWNRFAAGNFYEEYAERQKEAGKQVKAISDLNISPDTVMLVGTIAKRRRDPKYIDELMNKALNRQISRQDLRKINCELRQKQGKSKTPISAKQEAAKRRKNLKHSILLGIYFLLLLSTVICLILAISTYNGLGLYLGINAVLGLILFHPQFK